ncbi:hypothetical protein [Kribbella sp. NPDC048915]|uniref:hypothetical protein n=1 Tax=Kribbella sp. NPDC048915 TaxID=3155148 RepID=UPI0033C619A2
MNDSNPLDALAARAGLRELAEQLSLEYAGAVAPGRVLSLVLTTGHRIRRQHPDWDDLLRVTKSAVRANLTTLIGTNLAAGTHRPTTAPTRRAAQTPIHTTPRRRHAPRQVARAF